MPERQNEISLFEHAKWQYCLNSLATGDGCRICSWSRWGWIRQGMAFAVPTKTQPVKIGHKKEILTSTIVLRHMDHGFVPIPLFPFCDHSRLPDHTRLVVARKRQGGASFLAGPSFLVLPETGGVTYLPG